MTLESCLGFFSGWRSAKNNSLFFLIDSEMASDGSISQLDEDLHIILRTRKHHSSEVTLESRLGFLSGWRSAKKIKLILLKWQLMDQLAS